LEKDGRKQVKEKEERVTRGERGFAEHCQTEYGVDHEVFSSVPFPREGSH
jgi:hypothetical protein